MDVDERSLSTLDEGKWLNDIVIGYYLNYIQQKAKLGEDYDIVSQVHIFDTIFFSRLDEIFKVQIDRAKLRELRKWYDGIDIFSKDFLIFPICKDHHWFVMIVCYAKNVPYFRHAKSDGDNIFNESYGEEHNPAILTLDSLGLKGNYRWAAVVRDFLDYEWRRCHSEVKRFGCQDIIECRPNVPHQTNSYDCGLYMLAYVECFLMNPRHFYCLTLLDDTASMLSLNNRIKKILHKTTRKYLKGLMGSPTNSMVSSEVDNDTDFD